MGVTGITSAAPCCLLRMFRSPTIAVSGKWSPIRAAERVCEGAVVVGVS